MHFDNYRESWWPCTIIGGVIGSMEASAMGESPLLMLVMVLALVK